MNPKEYIDQQLIKKGKYYKVNKDAIALYHKDIERMANYFNIRTDVQLVASDLKNRCAVCKGLARIENKTFTSLGEAHPDNNDFEFFTAVAEKRAVDRAILKALDVHGEVYSYEEFSQATKNNKTIKDAEDFLSGTYDNNNNKIEEKPKQSVMTMQEVMSKKILQQQDIPSFNKLIAKYQDTLSWLLENKPEDADKIYTAIQNKRKQLEKQ